MAALDLSAQILAELAHGGRTVMELAQATAASRGDVADACFGLYDFGVLDNEAGVFLLRGPWAVTQ